MPFFNFFNKNKEKTGLATAIKRVFTHKKIDENFLNELEEILISNDVGVKTSDKIIEKLRQQKFDKSIEESEIKPFLAAEISEILQKNHRNLQENLKKSQNSPKTIIFSGVNGSGKTTTIGKITHNLVKDGQKVLIAACDTFRAAAADQLAVWAQKNNAEIIRPNKDGEDPAAVAYRALDFAQKHKYDYLLIDTAGRLQNKQNLMEELKKIHKTLKKLDPHAPNENLLVIDATTGQNAKSQLEIFDKIINISGLILTKMDGSSKGGIAIALCDEFAKPIYAIGTGEKSTDLVEFDPENFAKNLIES